MPLSFAFHILIVLVILYIGLLYPQGIDINYLLIPRMQEYFEFQKKKKVQQ